MRCCSDVSAVDLENALYATSSCATGVNTDVVECTTEDAAPAAIVHDW
jgi:hypothetical protein